ncbi:DgaE family pyridoxal phosphate-dependent ammonia lyase [Bacillus niameyensis]|uniref:DgaE family pyridoxal phosphate-dependent ammonia lyase n=1 Tax=Bacillus niameyensis TaxID=1522308 RepID=UPI000782ED43|nr:DgaE family pyridoxal phosphate-dependent ammonia lyase [Bacillus niameyensis]
MESMYTSLGIKTVINASGKMTALGSSILSEKVADVFRESSQYYVDIEKLIEAAGKVIAKHTGAEDGCPVNSAASGIAISVAALVAGKDQVEIEKLPNTDNSKNEFILQKGHDVNFGANLTQMVRLGGGVPKLVGSVNKVDPSHISGSINEKTAGIIYVISHHAVQKGMVSLKEVINIAKDNNIPLIIDAAAEQDLKGYIQKGADAVIYSGSKAVNGPTSGYICGKKSIMEACRRQYNGIGRAMKVSKESIMGLLASLEQYTDSFSQPQQQKQEMVELCDKLNQLNGLSCELKRDEAGRDIYRAAIKVEDSCRYTAIELLERLQNGNPSIYLRSHNANIGTLLVDPRPLKPGETDIIVKRFNELLGEF